MQEDKEALFDAIDTSALCLEVLAPMLRTATFHPANMKKAAAAGFINATDCADYLVGKGIPFRDAYGITGALVRTCVDKGITLEDLSIDDYKAVNPVFDEGIYDAIDLLNCVNRRALAGGPAPEAVKIQIENVLAKI
jgi:argininosuccinate lyase